MRISSRAVIIENNKVLTMFRRKVKDGKAKEYYVIPGGGQDEGETLEETVVRELKEEMNIDIKVLGYLGRSVWEDTTSNFFHCEITNGTPHLGGEELERMNEENYYEPRFVELSELDKINIIGVDFIEKAIKSEYTNLDSKKI